MKKILFLLLFMYSLPVQAGIVHFDPKEIDKHFKDVEGCFLLYEITANVLHIYNQKQCEKRQSPCSSFKVFNAMIGLDSGAVTKNTIFKWDGKPKFLKVWEKSHHLSTAIKYSVVWFFQEMVQKIGKDKIQHYLDKAHYGNRDLSAPLTKFWLYPHSLKISAFEQLDMLKGLYNKTLPFKQETMEDVQDMLVLENNDGIILSGKTGSGMKDNKWRLGWFIGHLKRGNREFIFVTNMEGKSKASGLRAKKITKNILADLELINKK